MQFSPFYSVIADDANRNLLLSKLYDFNNFGRENIPILISFYIADLQEEHALDMELQAWCLK